MSNVDLKKKQRKQYEMQELLTSPQDMTVDPAEIHQALTEHFNGWYAKPENGEQELHNTELDWGRIFNDQEYFMAHKSRKGSPLCWTALFDILLRMLDAADKDPFMCRGANGRLYRAGETAFADDMESTTATNMAMQIKAEVVSAFCLIFELSFSPAKLRSYFQDWSRNVTASELVDMIVYTSGWQPYSVKIEVEGITPYLGRQYPITPKYAK
eukprot:gene42113-biopygen4325